MDAGPAAIGVVTAGLIVIAATAWALVALHDYRARRRETFRLIALDVAEVQARTNPRPTPEQLADVNPPSVGQRQRVAGATVNPEPVTPATDQQRTAS